MITGELSDEPFHPLLFYSVLSGFARDLQDDVDKHGPIEKYRRASLARSATFDLSAPGQTEFTVASALADYIDQRVYLLDASSRDWSVAVIRDPVVTRNLLGVERALAAIPEAAWLGADVDQSSQVVVDWANSQKPPALTTSDPLRRIEAEFPEKAPGAWRTRLRRPVPAGGVWWSAPAGVGLPSTTRKLRSFSAVELICRDDSLGETQAAVWNVSVAAGVRVAEIHDLADWSRLVEAYPLDVTASRGPEWSPRFGWAGPWLLPDWVRLARNWDGVHVSAAGYLRSKERMSAVGDGGTVLDGWDPDATYWLTDVITLADSDCETWADDPDRKAGWHQAS